MAVLFPTSFGYTLKPDKPAELLQGFVNIQNVEGVTTGKLTKSNLDEYSQKRFVAADPSSNVASYLNTNFDAIAKLDGDATSISTDDLVQVRSDLPTPTTPTPPAPNPGDLLKTMMSMLLLMFQRLFGASSSQFGY